MNDNGLAVEQWIAKSIDKDLSANTVEVYRVANNHVFHHQHTDRDGGFLTQEAEAFIVEKTCELLLDAAVKSGRNKIDLHFNDVHYYMTDYSISLWN